MDLISLFTLLERQGRFKGDLHLVQQVGLQAVMNQEDTKQAELERYRIEMAALSSNPATSPELMKVLFKTTEDEEELDELEDVDWITPQSTAELKEALKDFDLVLGSEDSDSEPN